MIQFLVLPLILVGAHAMPIWTPALYPTYADLIAEEVIQDFTSAILADDPGSTDRFVLRRALAKAVATRIRAGETVDLAYPLRPWRKSLIARVEDLAVQMFELTEPDHPLDAKGCRIQAIEILARLAVLRANNSGRYASTLKAISNAILGRRIAELGSGAPYEDKSRAARDAAIHFWTHLGQIAREHHHDPAIPTAPEEIFAWTAGTLGFDRLNHVEACEAWLDSVNEDKNSP